MSEEMASNEENIINIDKEDLQDEQPLTQSEEERLQKIKEDRIIEKLSRLRARVLSIKTVIEEEQFIEIFVKPIRGNIAQIKEDLERVDKPRSLAMYQGALGAYRKMLNFPETAVDSLAKECSDIERELPLFYGENEMVKECRRFRFDRTKYKILTE